MRRLIILILNFALLAGCSGTQPRTGTSPLARTGPATEVLIQSPLALPVPTPDEAPAVSKSGESQLHFPMLTVAPQPIATPTRIVIDLAETSATPVAETQSQVTRLIMPLIHSLQSAIPRSQASLLAVIRAAGPAWESAFHRNFLPLIVNQPFSRSAQAQRLFDCSKVERIPRIECETLLLFYLDTNGAAWREQRKWLRDPDPCNWGGMQCYESHVRVLQEERNNLTGVLPPEIDRLPITFLLLADNALHGSVPDSLVNMTQLESIDLSRNQLTGLLPQGIAKFPNLRSFSVDKDKLWFNLDSYSCDGVNTILKSECEALVLIYRTMNGRTWKVKAVFSNSPPSQGDLFADEWLVGPDPCRWKGINCVEKHLDILDLQGSNLSGLVSSDFGKLTNLGQLNLSGNHLYGPLPREFKNLTTLRYLRLGGNVRPPAVADDLTAKLCIPSEVFLRLERALSVEDMPPGGFCTSSN